MKNYGTRPLQLFSLIRTDTDSKKPAGSYQLLQNAMMMIICFEFWFLVPFPLKILKLKIHCNVKLNVAHSQTD